MSANAEIIAELRRVLNERDEARASCPDCAMWAERSARWHDDMQRAERERDEARAEVERLKAISRDEVRGMTLEQVSDLVVAESLWTRGYRRGAEAMREACLGVVERFMDFGSPHPGMIAHKISALPIPEDK